MYDGSAGFDLLDAVYLGRALAEAGYLWYEEPMREFSVTAYRRLAERVDVPLLVGRDPRRRPHEHRRLHRHGLPPRRCAPGAELRGGITGALRIAHLADAYGCAPRSTAAASANTHLCMAIPNTTYYESLVHRQRRAGASGRRRRARPRPDGARHRSPRRPGLPAGARAPGP